MNLSDLSAPFPPDRISWRVGSTTKDKSKGMALAYIDARDVQDRLDAVCGVMGWQSRYVPMHDKKTVCEIGIYSEVHQQWVWKADGAGDSDVEAEKGALSDAFKRAAVKWGIGRYLYDLDSPWVEVDTYEKDGKKFVKGIKPGEYAKLRRCLPSPGATPAPSQAPPPDTDLLPADLPLMLPGNPQPYTRCTTAEVWVMEINDLAAKITNSAKISEDEKADKLGKLHIANRDIIDALPEELRNGLSF